MHWKYHWMLSNLPFKNSAHGNFLESGPMAYRLNKNNHRKNMRFLMLIKNIFGYCFFVEFGQSTVLFRAFFLILTRVCYITGYPNRDGYTIFGQKHRKKTKTRTVCVFTDNSGLQTWTLYINRPDIAIRSVCFYCIAEHTVVVFPDSLFQRNPVMSLILPRSKCLTWKDR